MEREQTPLPPLVSDEDLRTRKNVHGTPWAILGTEIRDFYEKDRAKTREVVQALCDDMRRLRIEYANRVGYVTQIGVTSLALAKQLKIEPKP